MTQTVPVETCDKCLSTSGELGNRGFSSPMAVRGKSICDFTSLATERLGRRVDCKRTTQGQGSKWENELDKQVVPRANMSETTVQEGILVNLESDDCETKEDEAWDKRRGPRHCSVRMQAGSSNILLDNVVDSYTPVLYKSRSDVLVHSPLSRSGSSNSSLEDKPLRTETQI